MQNIKYSRQRESIKSFLLTCEGHPTADTIYENLRKNFPNISLGTVYRNLALLEKIGSVNKISSSNGADRYDGNVSLHNHFTCKKCQNLVNLKMENIDHIKEVAAKNFDGEIEGYTAHFYGLCDQCASKQG